MDMELLKLISFFLLVAFIPSIFWIIWLVRKAPDGPGFFAVLAMFIWGAVFAVIIAVILSFLLPGFSPWRYGSEIFFMAVIVAPLVEELAKPLGLKFGETEIVRLRDGIILGATAGLGFAATENLLYGLAALNEGGWYAFWVTAALRGMAACALHASATAVTGVGYARANLEGRTILAIVPFYLLAVFMHGFYNYMAIQGTVLGLVGAVLLALVSIAFIGKGVSDDIY